MAPSSPFVPFVPSRPGPPGSGVRHHRIVPLLVVLVALLVAGACGSAPADGGVGTAVPVSLPAGSRSGSGPVTVDDPDAGSVGPSAAIEAVGDLDEVTIVTSAETAGVRLVETFRFSSSDGVARAWRSQVVESSGELLPAGAVGLPDPESVEGPAAVELLDRQVAMWRDLVAETRPRPVGDGLWRASVDGADGRFDVEIRLVEGRLDTFAFTVGSAQGSPAGGSELRFVSRIEPGV